MNKEDYMLITESLNMRNKLKTIMETYKKTSQNQLTSNNNSDNSNNSSNSNNNNSSNQQ